MEIFNLRRTESLVNLIRQDVLSAEQHENVVISFVAADSAHA